MGERGKKGKGEIRGKWGVGCGVAEGELHREDEDEDEDEVNPTHACCGSHR